MNARRNRILVLDSDEQVLIELERLLEDEGFDATTTWDTAEALLLARSRHFDLLLVGDHPPEVTAGELLRDLQCERVSIPCVIMQTGTGPFDPEYFYALGASGVIPSSSLAEIGRCVAERFAARREAANK